MAPLGQTIAVIDKSGKVVSTSKNLFGVFSEAKNAYLERKAQIQSERNAKIAEMQALKMLENYQIDDAPSVASSRRSHRSRSRHHSGRRHHPSSYYEQDLHSVASHEYSAYDAPREMVRRHTHHDITAREPTARPMTSRSKSDANIDMDLAYGEYHPAALERSQPQIEDQELNGLVQRTQWLLEEAQCVHHSATATIAHLQKNPDAMAAVALTLAEISNIAAKMAPTALGALKSAAPVVFSLLASPQFLIAAGVGIGVTIVMFGGYKIIKQIQNGVSKEVNAPPQPADMEEPRMDEILEIDPEHLSSVEMWRRGVADVEAVSMGTSVDGEFITPTAAAMSGIDVTTARMTRDPRFRFDDDVSEARSHRSRRSRASHRSRRDGGESHVASKAPSRASKFFSKAPSEAPSKASSRHSEKEKKPKEKVKRSSRLRLMFTA